MKRYIQIISAYCTYLIATYLSRSFLVTLGCGKMHISALSCMASLTSLGCGATAGFSLLLVKKIVGYVLFGHGVLATSLYLPTFCAMLYWSSRSWLVRCGIPFVCMIAFLAHPVGYSAGWYTMFWLIPMILYCLPGTSIVSDALGSAFIAHAVGSVIWIYTFSTTPEYWYMLMPVVLYERLFIAAGMVVMHTIMRAIERSITVCYVLVKTYCCRTGYVQ